MALIDPWEGRWRGLPECPEPLEDTPAEPSVAGEHDEAPEPEGRERIEDPVVGD